MNKKLTVLMISAAIASAFCLSACGGDKPVATTAAPTAATTAAAVQSQETSAAETSAADTKDAGTNNGDGIPKEGDMYKGKKVGSVEKVPDCDDDKHGVIYIYDENDELIEAIKY